MDKERIQVKIFAHNTTDISNNGYSFGGDIVIIIQDKSYSFKWTASHLRGQGFLRKDFIVQIFEKDDTSILKTNLGEEDLDNFSLRQRVFFLFAQDLFDIIKPLLGQKDMNSLQERLNISVDLVEYRRRYFMISQNEHDALFCFALSGTN